MCIAVSAMQHRVWGFILCVIQEILSVCKSMADYPLTFAISSPMCFLPRGVVQASKWSLLLLLVFYFVV